MSEWNAMTFEGKDTILRVVQQEAEQFYALAEAPGAWTAPTACTEWEVRDAVGHIVDTIEGYFPAFDAARGTAEDKPAAGLPAMAERANAGAKSLSDLPQDELMDRLRSDQQKLMEMLQSLGADDWTWLMATHPYMGPVPAFFYAAGQLMDFGVHSWDIRQGTGRAHGLSGDAADLLVPFMFALWQGTVRQDRDTTPFQLGIRVTSGHNAGDTRVTVDENGMAYEQGSVDDLPAVLEFDAGSLVLTTFGRSNAGTVRGDQSIADRYLNLFFRI
jgi:uncharacterized protein (TIGR03083 family)